MDTPDVYLYDVISQFIIYIQTVQRADWLRALQLIPNGGES